MSLTISQALRKISKLKGEIAEHRARVTSNVSYLKEKPPVFKFSDELQKLNAAKAEMLDLQSRVAKANATKMVEFEGKKMTLAHAVRMLDEIKDSSALLKGLFIRDEVVKANQQEWNPVTNQHMLKIVEIVYVSDLSEVDRDAQVKELESRFEALNDVVESVNHKTTV